MNRALSPRQRSGGFTLIEVLVSLILIAVALLGLASVLLKVSSNAQSALLRSEASILLTDMAEKLAANRANVLAKPTDYTATVTDCTVLTAASTTVATRDIGQFQCLARMQLPSGSGTVTVDSVTAPTLATVQVSWDDSRGSGGANTQRLALQVSLK